MNCTLSFAVHSSVPNRADVICVLSHYTECNGTMCASDGGEASPSSSSRLKLADLYADVSRTVSDPSHVVYATLSIVCGNTRLPPISLPSSELVAKNSSMLANRTLLSFFEDVVTPLQSPLSTSKMGQQSLSSSGTIVCLCLGISTVTSSSGMAGDAAQRNCTMNTTDDNAIRERVSGHFTSEELSKRARLLRSIQLGKANPSAARHGLAFRSQEADENFQYMFRILYRRLDEREYMWLVRTLGNLEEGPAPTDRAGTMCRSLWAIYDRFGVDE